MLVAACFVFSGVLCADEGSADEPIVVPRTTGGIMVDGVVNEVAWADAARFEVAFEVQPGENIPPPVRTEVFLTWDDEAVLVAFRCEDSQPSAIRARYSDRDHLFKDDWVAIVLDTFNDQRRAYEFVVNPLGVQMDALNDDVNRNYDISWNAIWSSKGRLTATGWEAEIAIPFSQIRFQATDGPQVWGIDLVRSYPRIDRHHIGLFPRDRGNNSYLSQTVKIIGFESARPGKNLEIVPTVTGARTQERDDVPAGPLAVTDSSVDAGVTGAWGVTANATVAAAVNPDYSQVEADAVQLDINQTFALFFNETRPFFKVSADYFATRLRLLHTRVIADPVVALKATGKTGRNTLGLFSVLDDVTNVIVPGAEESQSATFEEGNLSTVGRYRYDFGKNSTIGTMITDREGGDGYFNRVLSFDARIRVTDSDSFVVNGAYSKTRYNADMVEEFELADDQASGHALVANYNHTVRDWSAWFQYRDIAREYRADLGFQPSVDFRRGGGGGERYWWGAGESWYNRIELGSAFSYGQRQDGSFYTRDLEVWAGYDGPYQSNVHLGGALGERVYAGESFSTDRVWFRGKVDIGGDVELGFRSRFGDWIDFENVRQATLVDLSPWLTVRAGRHLELSLNYSIQALDVQLGRLYAAHTSDLRAVWQFNLRTFVRAILQHTDVDRDPALYSDEVDAESRGLLIQLLFSYKVNPRTVVFAGYTEGSAGTQDYGSVVVSRTVFAKVGYSFGF